VSTAEPDGLWAIRGGFEQHGELQELISHSRFDLRECSGFGRCWVFGGG
jgi:hypothetical protein